MNKEQIRKKYNNININIVHSLDIKPMMIKELQFLIPKLYFEIYKTNSNWISKPSDWPKNIPFKNPRHRGRKYNTAMARKRELKQMCDYLKKKYILLYDINLHDYVQDGSQSNEVYLSKKFTLLKDQYDRIIFLYNDAKSKLINGGLQNVILDSVIHVILDKLYNKAINEKTHYWYAAFLDASHSFESVLSLLYMTDNSCLNLLYDCCVYLHQKYSVLCNMIIT